MSSTGRQVPSALRQDLDSSESPWRRTLISLYYKRRGWRRPTSADTRNWEY